MDKEWKPTYEDTAAYQVGICRKLHQQCLIMAWDKDHRCRYVLDKSPENFVKIVYSMDSESLKDWNRCHVKKIPDRWKNDFLQIIYVYDGKDLIL